VGASQAPAGLSHLLYEKCFMLAGGLELIAKAGEEDIEFFLILVGEDGERSGQSVLGGVPRGGGFAFRRFRAGGQGGVVLVGCDLRDRSRVFLPA
jgi:hypothetical protein